MEHLLHYVWKHKLFPLKVLQTTEGLPVEVIDSGLQNPNGLQIAHRQQGTDKCAQPIQLLHLKSSTL